MQVLTARRIQMLPPRGLTGIVSPGPMADFGALPDAYEIGTVTLKLAHMETGNAVVVASDHILPATRTGVTRTRSCTAPGTW